MFIESGKHKRKEVFFMKTRMAVAMDQKGIKGSDIRRKLDVSEAMASRWRTGKMYVAPKYQGPLSELLGVPPEDLFDERGIPKVVKHS